MKNNKGFTIVELVIVIAVIAILAAVLIPTFSGVIQKANASAAQQQAASAEKVALSMSKNATLPSQTAFIIYNGDASAYYYEYVNNKLADTDKDGALAMSLDGYSTALGSVIVSVDYFLANGEEVITPKTTPTAASESIQSLVKKLADVNGIAIQAFADKAASETTYYTFTQNEDKTGYIFTFKNVATSEPAPTSLTSATEVNVFTSVDLNKDCLIFVPEYTKNS